MLRNPAATVNAVTVIAAYRFVDIDDCQALRQTLLQRAQAAGLKGTVLLAHEGINLSLAGAHQGVQQWLQALREDPRFAGIEVKSHAAPFVPFQRLLVKVKREIIRMNQPDIRPQAQRARAVDADTLRRWLDQGHDDTGKPVLMLDTRNAFEVDAGAFANAVDWRLARFSDFPAALAAQGQALHCSTVVSYCTGGIRCEKAALWMVQSGVEDVWQLDGGILNYLQRWPDAPHWQGRCVVFDERQAVDPCLLPAQPHTETA
jgi:UPF0176 protein